MTVGSFACGRFALSAIAAGAIFTAAYDDWADDPTADFSPVMQRSLADLRHAIGDAQAVGT